MRWFYWLPLLLFAACGPEPLAVEEPDDLMPIQKMVDVIVDLNIIEAQIAEVQLLQKVIKDSVHEYYGQLFTKHSITRIQLNSSVDYYATQGVVMDSIYTRVMAKLTFLEKQLDHVELKQDELTHLPAEKMVELLMDTSLSNMVIDPKMKYQDKYDSILAYYRSNKNLLDSADVNFRQFGASLKNHAGNQKRLNKLVNAIGEKFRDR